MYPIRIGIIKKKRAELQTEMLHASTEELRLELQLESRELGHELIDILERIFIDSPEVNFNLN